jgi:putative phosphoesterase
VNQEAATTRVGLIADTHGLLRPAALDALQGVHAIIHAGDVGHAGIIHELETIAPVHAVRGNTDAPGDMSLHDSLELEIGGLSVHVSHGHELGAPAPEALLLAYPADVIVYGHTHRQLLHRSGNRLVVNPGAAGPRRFNLPACVAVLSIADRTAEVAFVELG